MTAGLENGAGAVRRPFRVEGVMAGRDSVYARWATRTLPQAWRGRKRPTSAITAAAGQRRR